MEDLAFQNFLLKAFQVTKIRLCIFLKHNTKKHSHIGIIHFGKGCWNCGHLYTKNSSVKIEFLIDSFTATTLLGIMNLRVEKISPFSPPKLHFFAILKDNQNCHLEFRNPDGPRYEHYTRDQLLCHIPELTPSSRDVKRPSRTSGKILLT